MPQKTSFIDHGSTWYLRFAVLSFAALILGLCLFALPIGIASDDTGLYRWIFLGLYVPAVPFFYAIYQTMRLLGYIDHGTAFSDASAQAFARIKWCGALIAALFCAGLPYIYYVANKDDAPGVLAIALVLIGASTAVAVFAAVLQRLLTSAIAMKKENDLTV